MSLLDHARKFAHEEIEVIQADPEMLADRLVTGWDLIERESDPARKARLEDHWIRLLHEYEQVVDARNEPEAA